MWWNVKLSLRFYGPFKIIQKIANAAYKLNLSEESQTYLFFHILCLKKTLETHARPIFNPPLITIERTLVLKLGKVLQRRLLKKGCKAWIKILI